ncbi:MAG: hypothetical protein ACFFC6_01615 [Promethearchaeota archaeon]
MSNIQAETDWRLIEDFFGGVTTSRNSRNTDEDDTIDGNRWMTIGISFNITEDYVNLSRVQTATISGFGTNEGEIWIEGSNGSGPNGTILSSVESLKVGNGLYDYYIDDSDGHEYLLLPRGEYFVVMNDTDHDQDCYWEWYVTRDTQGDGHNNSVYIRTSYGGGGWWEENEGGVFFDAPLKIEVIPVEKNSTNHWVVKSYNLTNDVKIWYNTTADGGSEVLLDDSTWFKANDTTTHNFKSNTSVSFNLNFIANYTYSSYPINGIVFYNTQNDTDTFWNVTFSTRDVNNTYNVEDRTISISGLQSDWNGWEIYWNDSSSPKYSNLDGDPAISYNNGSSAMIINISTTWQNQTWNVSFNALNYLYSFYISSDTDETPLELPYQTYTMNDYNLSFVVEEVGNLTYWVDYPNGSQLLRLNIDDINTKVNDTWDIDSTFDNLTNVNGTYQIQAFWNNSDSTKVGTFTRTVDMFVNTSLDVQTDLVVVVDQQVNVTALYKSLHNDSHVQDAIIQCYVNWTSDETMDQMAGAEYNASFPTQGLVDIGEKGNITVVTQVGWFENWTETIIISFVGSSSILVNTSTTLYLEWRENTTLEIDYYNSTGNGIYPGVTFDIDGTALAPTWDGGDEVYTFLFNSTDYSGEGSFPKINISASHSDYLAQTWTFDLKITPGNTSISGWRRGAPLTNDTAGETQIYANSTKDNVTINLRYYHILTDDTLTTSAPTIVSLLPNYTPVLEPNQSWTIGFNVTGTGDFIINITFALTNYNTSTFSFFLSVLKAGTTVESELAADQKVFYAESYDFFLVYNNTNYIENITGLTDIVGININDTSKVVWLNETNEGYWFRFSSTPLPLGIHAINISFSHDDFNSSWIVVTFKVETRLTNIEARDALDNTLLPNQTYTYTRNFSPGDFDNFSIRLAYYDVRTGTILDVTPGDVTVYANVSIAYPPPVENGAHNWTFFFDGSLLGTFWINVTFVIANHNSSTFQVKYVIQPADSKIINFDPDIVGVPINASVKSGNTFDFWIVWQNEYNEYINDTDGLGGNGTSTDIVLLTTDPAAGNHSFRFSAPDVGVWTYNFIFETTNYTSTEFWLRFNVTVRFMNVSITLSTHYNNSIINTVQYNETYYFSIILNDTETGLPVTADYTKPLSSENITVFSILAGNHTFFYNASLVGNFSSLEIEFYLNNYANYTYFITFNVDKRRFQINDTWSNPANGSTPIQLKYGNTFNFSVFLQDQRTGDNVSASDTATAVNISFIRITSTGNHSFNYTAGNMGENFDLIIEFSLQNYHNISYFISFNVFSRFMIINGTLSNPDTDQTVDTPQYGELSYFNVFLMDNETYAPVNATIRSISSTKIHFIQIESTGNHTFYFNASEIGNFYDLTIIFNLTKYSDVTYTISFVVSPREMLFDSDLSTGQTIGDLQYGDIFFFRVYLNDSRTFEPLNISSYSGLPTNIYFENFTLSKGHFFRYEALELVVGEPYLIVFSLPYYNDLSPTYQIIISVFKAESELTPPPSPRTTYYTVNTDFFIIWKNIPNLPTSPDIRITDADLTIQTSSGWANNIIFLSEDNGNYSFSVIANQTGSFTLTLYFGSPFFVNQSFILSINILPAPTYFGDTSPENGTSLGVSTPFYFSEVYTFYVTWVNDLNDSGIEDLNPDYSLSGLLVEFVSSYPNGTHVFRVHGNRLNESDIVKVVLETTNFQKLEYLLDVRVSIMPTLPLDATSFSYNESILVEEDFSILGNESYLTYQGDFVPNTFVCNLWMNGSSISFSIERDENWFLISFSTEGNQYGDYNFTLEVSLTGYQIQKLSMNITLQGRETVFTVTLPSKTFEQGEPIEITALLNYTQTTDGGSGAAILLSPLSGVEVSFSIGLKYSNGTSYTLPVYTTLTDVRGEATYTIDGEYTQDAIGFSKIDVESGPSSSGLPSSYSMPAAELAEYEIIYIFDPLEIIIPVVIAGVVILLIVGAVAASGITLNRRRKKRSAAIQEKRRKVEQSFEDIKSIRLLIARHESGLQFYSEKTIAELQTDTDALSGMSAALSTFMEEVSDGMRSRTDEEKEKEKIEVMSREGLHMLIWHGTRSSFIIISETRLPDYFKERLANLGREVEKKFAQDLEDFYRSDQIPSNQIKKMIRKHIPLHYFSAFVLNEGVLTLESIKLSKKEKKMLKLIKEIRFQKEGVQFFFSEQIISHLSKHYNRSEAIKFLDRSIEINLLIEASQEDILSISK